MKSLLSKKRKTVNNPNPQYRLLVSYELDDASHATRYDSSGIGNVKRYDSIGNDNDKITLTTPKSLSSLRKPLTLSSDAGLLCFYGDVPSATRGLFGLYGTLCIQTRSMAVIWNPTVGKSVGIVMPIPTKGYERTIVGFGVCPDTSDPKLVKINVDEISRRWEVDVFSLSTRDWKTVYNDAAFNNLCNLRHATVSANGVIFFHEDIYVDKGVDKSKKKKDKGADEGVRCNFVISFDLKSEKFGEVCLPKRLVNSCKLHVAKVNESLGLLEYYDEGDMKVCGVWTRKDGANKPFTKIYTVRVRGKSVRESSVLGFTYNGDVVIELDDDDNDGIKVYKPSSGHISGVGINGIRYKFSARSYMKTQLLHDQSESDSIIVNNDDGALLLKGIKL